MNTISRERVSEVAGKFMLDGEILDIAPYGSGHINDTFRMKVRNKGTEKDYILQRMNGDIFKNREELMENIVRVTSFLKEKIVAQGGDPDRETLQIIPTRQGENFYKEGEDGWRVYPFITDTVSYDVAETPWKFNRSGYAFGNFQYLLAALHLHPMF